MTDTTSPSGTVDASPLNFHDGVSAIENLLSTDPETDLGQEDEAKGAVETKTTEAPQEADDDEIDIALDDEQETEAEAAQVAPAAVSDDTLVELQDGQKISIAELKRNNLFQRDYTQKTTALREQEKALEQQFADRVAKAEEEIKARADLVFRLSSQLIPQKPTLELLQQDPVGYMEAKELYDQRVAELNALYSQTEAERQKAEQDQKAQFEAYVLGQRDQLLQKIPKFKDEAKRAAFKQEAVSIGAEHYNITAQEIEGLTDARMIMVLHDAIQYRKAVAKSQQVKQDVTARPRLEQSQRMKPQTVAKRDQAGRFEAARRTGSINDAAKLIETLID